MKDITTTQDGESYDIARVVIIVNALALIPIFCLGVGFYLYGYMVARPFDMQTFFTSVLTYIGGVGTLLTTGSAAIFFKRSTEPKEENGPKSSNKD